MNILASQRIGNTLKVTVKLQRTEDSFHTVDALKKQRMDILQQKADDALKRDAEVADIDQLLVECANLGITGGAP